MKNKKLKLSAIINSGLDTREDLNCAESILKAANTAYKMKLNKTSLKLAAGFGGGMGIESTCGALTGSIMILSHLFVKKRAHESQYIGDLSKEFMEIFYIRMSTIDCKNLKEKYSDPETQCRPIVQEAALILEQIIDRELKK